MDLANAFFEFGGSMFVLNHARILYKEKMVRGLSLLSVVFFFAWGIFNIFYYSHLEQKFSWYAGMMVTFANLIWICMIVYYRRVEKLNGEKKWNSISQ